MQASPEEDRPRPLSRRTALRGAAGLAGAAWLVPVVTVVSMDSASAASAPPPGGGEVASGRLSDPGAQANSSLAFTGTDAGEAAIVGVATLAAGAAAIVAARRLRKTEPGTVPSAGRHRAEGDNP